MTEEIVIPPEVASLKSRRWRLFVLAYVGNAMGNAAEAARQAGYAESSAKVQGAKLLKRQEIIQAVDALANREVTFEQIEANQVSRGAIADAEEIQQFLTDVMRGEVGEPETNLAGEVVGMAPPKVRDRIKASENLSKMLGLDLRPPEQHLHLHGDITPTEAKAKLLKLREEND